MLKQLLPVLTLLAVLGIQALTLQHCATPTAPTGGAVDSIGPRLVIEESTPNFQTNFRPEEIVLTFDEWVEIDTKQPILISPPLDLGEENQPRLRRRSLVIPLEGLRLRDSVTYVVNIDAAIKDLNEGNPTDNLRFVFATGPVLDSATVSGTLVTDYSAEPIENATFTLYSNLADSAVTTENPTYFAQTDEDGNFTIYNVRPGIYRGVALQRNPSATNYFYDTSGFALPQATGFIDTLFAVDDGNTEIGTIRLSPVLKPVKVNAVDTTVNGAIRITLNQAAELVDIEYGGSYLRRNEADTAVLFYRQSRADTLYFGRNGERRDTAYITAGTPAGRRPFRLRESPRGKFFGPAGLRLLFDRPLESTDTSRIRLLRDTFPAPVRYTFAIDSTDAGVLTLNTNFRTDSRYALSLLPGALTDWAGNLNRDTIQKTFAADDPENYGTLNLTLVNLDPTADYILRLVEDDKPLVATRRYIRERFEYVANYPGLPPATYAVELLLDSNKNGRYDSGDLLFGLQPELVRRITIEPLRANWEVEQEIDVSTLR